MNDLEKKDVIKHSGAVQITNKINLLQRKAYNILLANAYDNLTDQDEHEVRIIDLKKVLGIKTRNNIYLKEILRALAGCVVEWNLIEKDDDEWLAYSLLSRVKIKKDKVRYAYDTELRQKLYNPNIFARIKLSLQKKFKSKYSLALYELCVDYYIKKRGQGKTPIIDLATFREVMGVEKNKYREFKTFNKIVVKSSIHEINDISDLVVDVEYIRRGRRVEFLQFYIKGKSGIPELNRKAVKSKKVRVPEHIENKELYKEMIACEIDPAEAEKFLMDESISEIQIKEKLAYAKHKNAIGEVKGSLGGFAAQAIRGNWDVQKSLFEIEKPKEKARETKAAIKKQKAQERERSLKGQYKRYVVDEVEKFRETLSSKEMKEIERKCRRRLEKKHGKLSTKAREGLIKNTIKMEVRLSLEKQAGLKSFDEWIESQK